MGKKWGWRTFFSFLIRFYFENKRMTHHGGKHVAALPWSVLLRVEYRLFKNIIFVWPVRLLMHEHKHSITTWTWPIANATIPLCCHLTTMGAVREQNDSTRSTKAVQWLSRSLYCSPLCCDYTHKATRVSCYDICKEGNCLPTRLGLQQYECRPAGGVGRRYIHALVLYGTTGPVWEHPKILVKHRTQYCISTDRQLLEVFTFLHHLFDRYFLLWYVCWLLHSG